MMTPRATAALAALHAVGTVMSLAAIGGWYLISLDQRQQQELVERHGAMMKKHLEQRK